MIGESLDQHRRELDLYFAALETTRDYMAADVEADRVLRALLAALQAELVELRRRVEAVEAELRPEAGRHSVGVGSVLAPEAFAVVNEEADPPEIVGTYLRSDEDVVHYLSPVGVQTFAPEDCVRVLPRSRAEAYVAKRSRS
jgi:hypothetical protein